MTQPASDLTRLSPAARRLNALLERALADGHTVVPTAVAGAVLGGVRLRLEDALAEIGPAGSALVAAPSPSVLGFRKVVEAEQEIAAHVTRLAQTNRLRVVAGPASASRDAVVQKIEAAVVDDAEYLDVETLAAFFRDCADDESVALAGDPDALPSPGPGRAFADIVEAGVVRASRVETSDASAVLGAFAAAVARGELPDVSDPSRAVVIVDAASAGEAAHRAGQLVHDSIPRVFGIDPTSIQVLTATAAMARVLTAQLDETRAPRLVNDAVGRRWPAVVLVLAPDSAGLLSRQLLYSATRCATRHLSIVQAAGSAFADAIAGPACRPRRTLLRALLAGYSSSSSSSDSHSSSSSSSSDSSRPSTGPNGVTSSYAENNTSSYASLADASASYAD
jgi:hypothetical protein